VFCSKKCRMRCGYHNQKAKRRLWKSKNYEVIRLSILLERDKYTCQICNKQVNSNVDFPHPEYPTIDHIIPLCKGGNHRYSNVQLAHWRCNRNKWDGKRKCKNS
jgi:5-methylcytosine-specific restriction endonuclease McrA